MNCYTNTETPVTICYKSKYIKLYNFNIVSYVSKPDFYLTLYYDGNKIITFSNDKLNNKKTHLFECPENNPYGNFRITASHDLKENVTLFFTMELYDDDEVILWDKNNYISYDLGKVDNEEHIVLN